MFIVSQISKNLPNGEIIIAVFSYNQLELNLK